jgi:hypothetical protein
MAINKNHEFEELNGVKCAIVERNASQERVDFLKDILEVNNYTVIAVSSPPPKAVPTPAPTASEETQPRAAEPAPAPATFTVGVTDVSFNPINAIFGRLLKTRDKHIVTLAYWKQKEPVPLDEIPYFEDRNS